MITSAYGIGTLHFGSFLDLGSCRELIYKALDFGINFFDTSPLYGNSFSEEILGEILSETSHPALIGTKVGLQKAQRKDGQFGVEVMKLSQTNIRDSVEKSLKRLRRERIDLLMLHAFDPSTPLSETVESLIQLHREGKIHYFGCSNYNSKQLEALLREVKKRRCNFFSAAQCHYNLIERRAERIFIPLCEQNGIQVLVNRALARGALSGQYRTGVYPEQSRAAKSLRIRKWLNPQRVDLLETLTRFSDKKRVSLTAIALMWIKRNHPTAIPLLGVRNNEQLSQCLQIQIGDETLFKEVEEIISKAPYVYNSPPRYFEK